MRILLTCVLTGVFTLGLTARADNPIVQTIYTADPAPLVVGDTLYVYTGHDEDKSTWFTMRDWRCFSTKDMVNWTDHGSPLSTRSFSWSRGDAWAGQCIERNGKFYFYIPTNKKGGGMCLGVAVSDTPTGPFKDALDRPLVEDGPGDIDPTVFIDDDGQAYLYWGNPSLKYVKLNADMVSYDKAVGVVHVPLTAESFGKREKAGDKRTTLYEEGPWLFKRQGKYVLAYAASGIPENIAYTTGPTATGPWTYQGIIMPQEGRSFTNHPGIVDFKGGSYFFYHNGALPGGNGFNRSVCVEQFNYNADGSFPTIRMSKDGPAPVGHLNPFDKTEAETICRADGVETDRAEATGVYVTDIDDGDSIKVKSVDFGKTGPDSVTLRVASDGVGGSIEIRLDGKDGPVIGTVAVPSTGGWQTWQSVSAPVHNATGIHDLFFVFRGKVGGKLLNVDSWQFSPKSN